MRMMCTYYVHINSKAIVAEHLNANDRTEYQNLRSSSYRSLWGKCFHLQKLYITLYPSFNKNFESKAGQQLTMFDYTTLISYPKQSSPW